MKTNLIANRYINATVMPAVQLLVHSSPLAFARGAYSQGKPIPEVHLFSRGIQASFQAPYIKHEVEIERPCVFCGALLSHYGHFLLETLAHMWFVKKIRKEGYNPLIVFDFSNCGNGLLDYQKQIFVLLGIEENIFFVEKPTLFKTLFCPEPGFILNYYCHKIHKSALSIANGESQDGKYIYISRSKLAKSVKGGCINEENVERMLQKYGFQIIYPEEMSIKEQIKSITTSQTCLMIEGSAQHTLMFIEKLSTNFFIIPRISNNTYKIIASFFKNYFSLNIPIKVIRKGEFKNRDFFEIDIDRLEEIIKKTSNLTLLNKLQGKIIESDFSLSQGPELQKIIYSADCSVSRTIRLFYMSCEFRKKGMLREAYRISFYLLTRSLYENYMVIRLIENISCYIKDLNYNKKEYVHMSKYTLKQIDNFLNKLKINQNWRNILISCSDLCIELSNYFNYYAKNHLSIYYLNFAVDIFPNSFKRRIMLCRSLIKNLYFDKAADCLSGIIDDFSHCSAIYITMGYLYESKNDIKNALQCLYNALKYEKDNVGAAEYLFYLLVKSGNINIAINEIKKFKKLNINYNNELYQMSVVYENMNELNKSIYYARKAIYSNMCCIKYRLHMCSLLRKKHLYLKSNRILLKLLRDKIVSSEVYLQLSYNYVKLKKINKAIFYILKAIDIDPKRMKLREVLYNCFILSGNKKNAKSVLISGLKINPFWAFVRLKRFKAY